jgi:HEAT repeat protein
MDTSARESREPPRRGSMSLDASEVISAATHGYLLGEGERFVGELLALLHSLDPSVRSQAATVLGVIGDERVLPSLRSASEDTDASVAAAAALARARLGDTSALPEACQRLTEQLRYGNPEQRALAARALGALGLHDACGPLAEALQDLDPDVRLDAVDALARLVATAQ